MKHRLIVLMALAIPIAARGVPDTSEAKAEKEIRGSLARWVEASNRGDWKEAVKIWAPDLIGRYPGDAGRHVRS